jgi:hypothetical protein
MRWPTYELAPRQRQRQTVVYTSETRSSATATPAKAHHDYPRVAAQARTRQRRRVNDAQSACASAGSHLVVTAGTVMFTLRIGHQRAAGPGLGGGGQRLTRLRTASRVKASKTGPRMRAAMVIQVPAVVNGCDVVRKTIESRVTSTRRSGPVARSNVARLAGAGAVRC